MMKNRNVLVIDCGSTKVPDIVNHVTKFTSSDVVQLKDLENINLKIYDGLIISGAPILITEVDPKPYLEKFEFLKTFNKPVLGICFGHQIIGLLNGAEAFKCSPSRTTEEITKLANSSLLKEIPQQFLMSQDHCECISLPINFKHIASSETCQNEMMEHTSKPIIGVQFHPEVSEVHGKQFFENFFENLF